MLLVDQILPDADHTSAALQASEESYRTIFELAGDAMFVHDIESGAILDANLKACEMHGCTLAELKSIGVGGISHGEPPFDLPTALTYIQRAAAGEPQRFEWLVRRQSGERFWVEVSLNRVRILGGERIVASVRNIDERKRAEDALRKARDELEDRVAERTADLSRRTAELAEAEQRFRAIVEASPTPLLLTRVADGTILFANDRLEQMIGEAPGSLTGRRTTEFYHDGGDRDRLLDTVARKGFVRDEEIRVRRADGKNLWVSVSIRPLVFDGEPALATAFRDITERKRAEEMLRDREEHFRSLIENASDIIAVVDEGGFLRYASPATERILGYRVEERIGRPSDELLHEDDAVALRRIYEELKERPTDTHRFEFRFRHKEGTWRVLEGILTAMYGENRITGIIINARDVTKRKEAEDALRLQTALLEAQGESLMDGMLVVSPEGRILYYNKRFVDMFGVSRDALEARSDKEAIASVLSKLVDRDAFVRRVEYLYAHPGERARDEVALRDGRILDRYSAPVTSHGGDHYGRIWFFRDITAQKRHALELERARVEADVAREQADHYSRSLHHELEVGRQIQQGFLPSALPQVRGWETAVRFKPAWQVSGDFYDVFRLEPNLLGLVIADVCGKGVGAALFMALYQSLLRTSAERANTASEKKPLREAAILLEAFRSTNDYVQRVHRPSHVFASVFFGLLEPETGVLTYVNGGHEPPVLLDGRGEARRLGATGPAVGLVPEASFGVASETVEPGAMLVAFTDGITEARNTQRELFSDERVLDLLRRPFTSAAETLQEIEKAVCRFTGTMTPPDDITLLALRRDNPS